VKSFPVDRFHRLHIIFTTTRKDSFKNKKEEAVGDFSGRRKSAERQFGTVDHFLLTASLKNKVSRKPQLRQRQQ
jgi:hypothetical protein